MNLLRDNQDVLIFPSGRINAKFNPENAKPGIAYLVNNLDSQIMPVYISDTYKISIKDLILRKRKVVITFGKDIDVEKILNSVSDYKSQAIEIAKTIKKLEEKWYIIYLIVFVSIFMFNNLFVYIKRLVTFI